MANSKIRRDPIADALAILDLRTGGLSAAAAARQLSITKRHAARLFLLLRLPEALRAAVTDGTIAIESGVGLARLPDNVLFSIGRRLDAGEQLAKLLDEYSLPTAVPQESSAEFDESLWPKLEHLLQLFEIPEFCEFLHRIESRHAPTELTFQIVARARRATAPLSRAVRRKLGVDSAHQKLQPPWID